jgi:hypothetical protein
MKLLLDGYIPNDIEYNLITMSMFYITEKGKKVNTHVVEVHVDSKEAKCAKELLSECWHQETFVKELEERSVGMLIDFIPNIQKGVMEVLTFCETLRRQTEFAGNTIAILIEGIGGLEVKINHNGSLASLADIVKKLKSNEGKPLISGIKPTKFTSDSGRYLFLTQKNVVTKLNRNSTTSSNLLQKMASWTHSASKECLSITSTRSNRNKLPRMQTVSAPSTLHLSQQSKPLPRHQLLPATHGTAPPLSNFPTRNADDTSLSPPSLGTTQTELTDERTEFQATMATMQDALCKKIQSIKDANDAKARQAETCIQQAEKMCIATQETIVKEYETFSENYNNILEAFTTLVAMSTWPKSNKTSVILTSSKQLAR